MTSSALARHSSDLRSRLHGSTTVLQSLISIEVDKSLLSLHLELGIRHRRTDVDWMLRLDLASIPMTHEQWHGRAHCIGAQLNLEVSPQHWPLAQERWFLRLWLRNPDSSDDWELVETRPLP